MISLSLLPGKEARAFQIVEATRVAEVAKDMLMPTDAAFGEQAALYVLDGYRNRIVVREPNGTVRILSPEGECALNRPLGITTHNKNIYIANTGSGFICELDSEGRCLRKIAPDKKIPAPFVPTDIVIEGAKAIVADRGSNILHVYSYPAFTHIQMFRDFGKKGGTLNSPYLLDIQEGRILVTDIMNGRLVLLTTGGVFLNFLGERGVREGQFIRPKGVAIGSGRHVFVSDSTLGVVQVFDMDLNYRGTVGAGGTPLYFQHPAGLAAYGDTLAVVEQKRSAVILFKIYAPKPSH